MKTEEWLEANEICGRLLRKYLEKEPLTDEEFILFATKHRELEKHYHETIMQKL